MLGLSRRIALCPVLVALACGAPEPSLREVGRPPDLGQLDAAVREQFEQLRSRLDEPGGTAAESGAAWGALGQWFHVYHYGESAALCYRNARLLDPREPRWPYYLGVLAEEAGDLEAAAEGYRSAAALDAEPAPRVRLGDLALERQDLDDAEAIFRDVLAAHPDHPGALFGSGRTALARGDAAAALEPLEALAVLQPEAVEVRYMLSVAWRQLGEEERAAEQLRLVPKENIDQVGLDQDDPWKLELLRFDRGARTLTRRAVRATHRGELAKATALFARAVDADPAGPEKRVNYGVALRETGRWREAEEQLEEALRLAEDEPKMTAKAHLELARLLTARGRTADAASHLEAALAVDPRSVPAHLALGRLDQNQGRLEEALGHYAAARSIERAVADIRFWHAALLILLDRRQEALSAIEEDLRELGDARLLRLLLARLLAAAPEDELRDLGRARGLLAASNASPDAFFAETAAMMAAADGRFREAVGWQRAAVEALAGVRPRSSAHIARRRLVLYERGDPCRNPWEGRETPVRVPVKRP